MKTVGLVTPPVKPTGKNKAKAKAKPEPAVVVQLQEVPFAPETGAA